MIVGAWVYDTPALQLDCWMTLALAAARTSRIRLGPGVMIPSLRHPMVTASAIATLVSLVGESRVIIGIGTGFHRPARHGSEAAPLAGHAEDVGNKIGVLTEAVA